MAQRVLKFEGADRRELFYLVLEACRAQTRPAIEVDGKVYDDLLKVARLLPYEDELLPHHQAIVDKMFQKRQWGYGRTAYNLVHRLNSCLAQERRRAAMRAKP